MTHRLFGLLSFCALSLACDPDPNDPTEAPASGGKADGQHAICCDPADDPGGPELAHCCENGQWEADLGSNNAAFTCMTAGHGGVGQVCEEAPESPACCDPEDDPGGPEGTQCCADGSWVANIGNVSPTLCDPFGGVGEVCEEAPEPPACCDPADDPGGPELAHCCENGLWESDLGSGNPELTCMVAGHGGVGEVCGSAQ